MPERILSQVQVAEVGFLWRVHGVTVTLHNKVCSCEIRRVFNVETLLRIERLQLRCFCHVSTVQNAHEILAREVLLTKPTGKRPRGLSRPRWSNYTSDHAWSHLGVEPAELSDIAVDRGVFQVFLVLLPPQPSQVEKHAIKIKTFTHYVVYSPVFKSAQLMNEQVP